MSGVFVAADNIITSLGFSTAENWEKMVNGVSGIMRHNIFSDPVFASLVNTGQLDKSFQKLNPTQLYTRFEKLIILSISHALENIDLNVRDERTLLILSSTKGNVDLLEGNQKIDQKRVYLSEAAKVIRDFFGNPNTPIVLSNSCISGVLAILLGTRLIKSRQYDNVIVSGADIVSNFVVAGFQSLKALSEEPCRPFDKDRNGLNLGEGCGTVVLTSSPNDIEVVTGASSNDANHISGPSRDGQGLYLTIQSILNHAGQDAFNDIGYVSAHGTATLYNDEMEAHAISRSGLEDVPMNSLKGYFGHTLGAAGVIESIVAIQSLKNNLLLQSQGFSESGVSKSLNVICENKSAELKRCLKLGSGFGGCNAGILISKNGD